MKVEIVRTATLYVTLAASELTLIQANSWQEVPPLPHDLVLYPAPHPGSSHSEHGESEGFTHHADPPQVVARIQLRADFLSGFELRTAGDDALELHVPSREIPDLNRNLVGPVVLV